MSKSSYLLLNREEKVRKMSKTIVFIMIILFFVSCTKDKSIEPQDSNWCGTVTSDDTLTHKYIFKLQVNGLSSPDSIDFISSKSYNTLGNHYFKRFTNPTLSLLDSGFVFGKTGNGMMIIIYNADTTKSFTSQVFVNNTLRIQQIGHTNSITNKITTKYYF